MLFLFVFLCLKKRDSVNFELFIAKRIIRSKTTDNSINQGTRIILRFSILGVALGIFLMLLSLAVVKGFQGEIRSKVIGFGSHIQITEFNYENPLNFKPLDKDQPFYPSLEDEDGVASIQMYALKEGIIKTNDEIAGVIAKGISTDFNWKFFSQNLEEGSILKIEDSIKSNSVIISRHLSKQLKLNLNDKLLIYFIQNGKSRPRKLTVTGIYNTGMQQFDKAYILMDIKHIQRLNEWGEHQISGFEVLLNRYEDLFRMDKILYNKIPNRLNTTTITQQYREIFSWLELQDLNVIVIVTLLTLVCGINMITALLILILEKTNMIGIMKAVGATNKQVRKIFIYMAAYLVLAGLFWGNILGLSFIYMQDKFHLIGLDKSSYYMDYVPVDLGIFEWVVLNLCTFILCVSMLLLPAFVISNISPSKSIRFN